VNNSYCFYQPSELMFQVGIPTGEVGARKDVINMQAAVLNQYVAHLDTKKRLTIRGTIAQFFAVKIYSDGHVLLEPRVLVAPEMISKRSLKMMDQSVSNLKKQKVSQVIDLKKYR